MAANGVAGLTNLGATVTVGAGGTVTAALLTQTVGRIRKFVIRGYAGATQIMQTMQETIQGARIVKSFNLEDEMLKVAQNQSDYQLAASLYSKGLGLMKIAIGKGR